MSNDNRMTEVKSVQRERGSAQRQLTSKAGQLVLLLFGIVEALIALRILLKLIAANPSSPIAVLIYGATDWFLRPFVGLIAPITIGGMVLEPASFFAITIYALVGWVIQRAIWVLFSRPRGPIVAVTQTTTSDQYTP